MTNKEFLRYVRSASHRIDNIKATKQMLLDSATSITARYDGEPVKASGTTRRPEEYAISVQDIELKKWTALLESVTAAIYKIPDPKLQDVLELYYVQHLAWNEVSKKMNYSESTIKCHLHPAALNAFVQPEVDTL